MYHLGPNNNNSGNEDTLAVIGLVIGLDYKNPYLNPYREFQRLKLHPKINSYLKGATRISYGSRALNEGGFQGIPNIEFPGGVLVGCSAGFLNVSKIKGIHNAIESGILCAESLANNKSYQLQYEKSSIFKELKAARNVRPSFNTKFGWIGGLAYSGIFGYLFKVSKNKKTVCQGHSLLRLQIHNFGVLK